jgi:uncharacterized protein YjbI with pentapeptide repeats
MESSRSILRRYAASDRDFRGLDIEDLPGEAPFHGANLDGADFSGAWILVDFSHARLRGAQFVEANVKTCSFDHADLQRADFSRAALCATTFACASMADAVFEGACYHSYVLARGERPDW